MNMNTQLDNKTIFKVIDQKQGKEAQVEVSWNANVEQCVEAFVDLMLFLGYQEGSIKQYINR
jgi:hypothetical protein